MWAGVTYNEADSFHIHTMREVSEVAFLKFIGSISSGFFESIFVCGFGCIGFRIIEFDSSKKFYRYRENFDGITSSN